MCYIIFRLNQQRSSMRKSSTSRQEEEAYLKTYYKTLVELMDKPPSWKLVMKLIDDNGLPFTAYSVFSVYKFYSENNQSFKQWNRTDVDLLFVDCPWKKEIFDFYQSRELISGDEVCNFCIELSQKYGERNWHKPYMYRFFSKLGETNGYPYSVPFSTNSLYKSDELKAFFVLFHTWLFKNKKLTRVNHAPQYPESISFTIDKDHAIKAAMTRKTG